MTNRHQTTIVIIGAGPTGLSMAAQLLRYKIDFIILEKNEKTTHLSKAVVVQARSLEIFDELGLASKAVERGQLTTAMNLYYKGRRKAFVDLAGLGDGISPFPFALSLEQSKTEALLAEYITEHSIPIQWRSEFTRLEQNSDGVIVHYKNSDGHPAFIEALYLVGCDGASSPVRHQLGFTFEGDTVPKLFYVADVALTSSVINKNELFMYMIKKGFILFFPMEGKGHYRIVGILPDAGDDAAPIEFSDIAGSIKQQVMSPLTFESVAWFSTYKVHSRKANAFSSGRCFIAGDAAHIHTPAGGQGMNTGIQDAYNLAWKLAFAARGKVNEFVTESYNNEREENARHLLQSTDRMFDFMSGANFIGNTFRLWLFPLIAGVITRSAAAKRRIFPLISQTGISYPDSMLTIKSTVGKVKAGVRMPYFVFENGKQIFDYLKNPQFKLLFFGNPGKQAGVQTEWPIEVDRYSFEEIPSHLFGAATGFYVLLRPDNHISYIGNDLAVCLHFLQHVTQQKSTVQTTGINT